jgi:hypothetical protein
VDESKTLYQIFTNGWHMVREMRRIRRGRNKGKFEVKYLKGTRLKKIIVPQNQLRVLIKP